MRIGTLAKTACAIRKPRPLVCAKFICEEGTPTVSVYMSESVAESSGHQQSFHVDRKVKMPSVACAGSDNGNRMRQKILKRDAPSSAAASSSSRGVARKYCVNRNTPNEAASHGRINPR